MPSQLHPSKYLSSVRGEWVWRLRNGTTQLSHRSSGLRVATWNSRDVSSAARARAFLVCAGSSFRNRVVLKVLSPVAESMNLTYQKPDALRFTSEAMPRTLHQLH